MTPEEFRARGRELIDWVADYLEQAGSYPVQSRARPGDTRSRLPDSPPERAEPFDAILRDLEDIILPGVTHWQSPSFFGYFPATNSPPSILGELVSAALGVQGMMWSTSPACTELETHVLDWLADMLALPDQFKSTGAGGGVIQDTASSATLCALLAARERASAHEVRRKGLRDADARFAVYASVESHSSVEKAAMISGLGSESLREVPADADFRMRPEALAGLIADDVAAGVVPLFVCATTGTTSSMAFDPIRPIGEICRRHGSWLHVDAAMAGTAALCEEFRGMHDGLELADSYCFNPHKWMLVNFDCDCFWVADRRALIDALSITPEYLRNRASESGEVIDYRDWQIPLGRRFRALKLWFVIRCYGIEGLQQHVRRHVRLAREFAEKVDADADFELAAPPALGLVCFRHLAGDEKNERIRDAVNEAGRIFITHTTLDGRIALRMAIGQRDTGREHVERAWREIRDVANDE